MAVRQDLKELLEAGAHFGHQARRWNPRMDKYIYTTRDKVHIFDLTITANLLNEACEFITKSVAEGQKVLFVCTKRQGKAILREEATRVGAPFIAERWLGGSLTNWEEIKKRINRLSSLKADLQSGKYEHYTKKEQVLLTREITRLERFVGGMSDLATPPDILFVVDSTKEDVAIKEAIKTGKKIVAMVDSNGDPNVIDYVIPANDDAVRAIKYVVTRIADAYVAGSAQLKK